MAWDILAPDFAAIDIGEVHDRRTITTNPAPRYHLQRFAPRCNGLHHPTAPKFRRILLRVRLSRPDPEETIDTGSFTASEPPAAMVIPVSESAHRLQLTIPPTRYDRDPFFCDARVLK
jgi:hypothetical protein